MAWQRREPQAPPYRARRAATVSCVRSRGVSNSGHRRAISSIRIVAPGEARLSARRVMPMTRRVRQRRGKHRQQSGTKLVGKLVRRNCRQQLAVRQHAPQHGCNAPRMKSTSPARSRRQAPSNDPPSSDAQSRYWATTWRSQSRAAACDSTGSRALHRVNARAHEQCATVLVSSTPLRDARTVGRRLALSFNGTRNRRLCSKQHGARPTRCPDRQLRERSHMTKLRFLCCAGKPRTTPVCRSRRWAVRDQ